MSFEGLKARDQRVFEWAWQRRVPLAFVMAGGYGVNIDDTVQVQMNTYGVALAYWQRWQRWQQSQHWQNQQMPLNPKPIHQT